MVGLDRCGRSCDTLKYLSNKIYAQSKLEDVDIAFLIMMKGINESKKLIKHISCDCDGKFKGEKCYSN